MKLINNLKILFFSTTTITTLLGSLLPDIRLTLLQKKTISRF
jgi:hypothetical protein